MRNPFHFGQYRLTSPAIQNPSFNVPDHYFYSMRMGLPSQTRSNPRARRNENKLSSGRTYGPIMSGSQIYQFLAQLFKNNEALLERGERPVPICIWGSHGIGKTSFVEQFCKTQEPAWGYSEIATAQFEEMGDFHGLPYKDEYVDEYGERKFRTLYSPPDWVPTEPGPGILLVDDFNRADGRILKGLMQFFQRGGLFSWKLPPLWQIVCTANPEEGEYQVTDLDGAMLTRMLHVTMTFDIKTWEAWALTHGLDERCVVLMRALNASGLLDGTKKFITPRSVNHLLGQLMFLGPKWADWNNNLEYIKKLIQASLDMSATDAQILIDPIISGKDVVDGHEFLQKYGKIIADASRNNPDPEERSKARVASSEQMEKIKNEMQKELDAMLRPDNEVSEAAVKMFVQSIANAVNSSQYPLNFGYVDALRQFLLLGRRGVDKDGNDTTVHRYLDINQRMNFRNNDILGKILQPVIQTHYLLDPDYIPYGLNLWEARRWDPLAPYLDEYPELRMNPRMRRNPRYARTNW